MEVYSIKKHLKSDISMMGSSARATKSAGMRGRGHYLCYNNRTARTSRGVAEGLVYSERASENVSKTAQRMDPVRHNTTRHDVQAPALHGPFHAELGLDIASAGVAAQGATDSSSMIPLIRWYTAGGNMRACNRCKRSTARSRWPLPSSARTIASQVVG